MQNEVPYATMDDKKANAQTPATAIRERLTVTNDG